MHGLFFQLPGHGLVYDVPDFCGAIVEKVIVHVKPVFLPQVKEQETSYLSFLLRGEV